MNMESSQVEILSVTSPYELLVIKTGGLFYCNHVLTFVKFDCSGRLSGSQVCDGLLIEQ